MSCIGEAAVETITQLIPPREGISVFCWVEAEEGREGEGGREGEEEVGSEVFGEGLEGGSEGELQPFCFDL